MQRKGNQRQRFSFIVENFLPAVPPPTMMMSKRKTASSAEFDVDAIADWLETLAEVDE